MTRVSYATPNDAKVSHAFCTSGQSESDPMTMPTTGCSIFSLLSFLTGGASARLLLDPDVAELDRPTLRLERNGAARDGNAAQPVELDPVDAIDERVALELDLQDVPFAEGPLDVRTLSRALVMPESACAGS